MVSYSLLEDDVPPRPQVVQSRRAAPPMRKFGPIKIRSECDMIVLAFVVGTLLLLMSDMFSNKTKLV